MLLLTQSLEKDINLLEILHNRCPAISNISSRIRNTNFKDNYASVSLTINDRNLAKVLLKLGLPLGKKSKKIFVPNFPLSEIDYWRGIIDGDGSLGFTNGKPYICLCTINDNIADNFKSFIYKISRSVSKTKKNSRDGAYNIKIVGQRAKEIVEKIYYPGCISLNRKYIIAKNIINFQNIKSNIHFSDDDDDYILSHSLDESIKLLNRSKRSIQYRISFLKNKLIDS